MAPASAVALAGRSAPRPAGRPELLDRLPTSFFLSPPMIAVGGVTVMLYGMVLFAVVSARRNAPPPPEPTNAVAYAPTAPNPTPPRPDVTDAKPAPPAPVSTPATPKATAQPEPAPTKAVEPSQPPPSRPKPDVVKPAPEPPKTEVAAVTPAPTPTPTPPKPAPGETWGPLSIFGSPGDCQIRADGDRLSINIPGSLHVLSPELGTMNAPRLLVPVRGDFTARVTVSGRILPGTDPLTVPAPLPFTFQGAGLLIWQDDHNYLRLERTSFYDAVEHKRLHRVLVENCRDGKTTNASVAARDSDLTLKFERRGSEIRCSYNPDGRNWVEVKRQNVAFPGEVRVGVSASNASPKPFNSRLEDFQLTAGNAAGGKGS